MADDPPCAFVAAGAAEVLAVLRRAKPDDKLPMAWRERPWGLDADTTPVTWSGVVQSPWDTAQGRIVVLWDAGLPRFVGRRRLCLPESDPWPDPEFGYALPVLRRARAPVPRRVLPTTAGAIDTATAATHANVAATSTATSAFSRRH
jgi:hypothetical protein